MALNPKKALGLITWPDRQHFSQRHFDRLRRAFLLVNSRGGVSVTRSERIGEFNIVLQQTLPGAG